MARVKLSALFTSIAGRYGGGVFRNWRGVTVLASLPASVSNPSTIAQEKSRGILSCSSKSWKALTVTVRDSWRAVASALTEAWKNADNSVGERSLIYPPRGPFTALGAITSACGLLGSVDAWECGDALPTAPVGVSGPALPLLGTLSGDLTAGLIITFTDPAHWGHNGSAGKVRVFANSEDGTFHTQMAGFTDAGAETTTLHRLRPRGGGDAIPLTEGWYRVQLDAVNAEGLRGAPSAIGEIYIEAPAGP